MALHFFARNLQADQSAALRPRRNDECPADQFRALAHGNQPDSPLYLAVNKAAAMILDFQSEAVGQIVQANPSFAYTSMTVYVVQRFLQHAIDMNARACLDGKQCSVLFIMHLDSRLAAYSRNIPVQCALQAGFFKQNGMERLGKRADIVERGLRDLLDLL